MGRRSALPRDCANPKRDVGTTIDGIILGGVLSGLVPRYCVEERQEMHRNLREDSDRIGLTKAGQSVAGSGKFRLSSLLRLCV